MNSEDNGLMEHLEDDILLEAVQEIGPLDHDYVMEENCEVYIKSEDLSGSELVPILERIDPTTTSKPSMMSQASMASQKSKDLMHRCPHCDYASNRRNNLQRHVKSTHKTTDQDVQLSYEDVEMEESETKNDEKLKKFGCDFCDFRSNRSSVMKGHIGRSHTFECVECDAVFYSATFLKSHVDESHHDIESRTPEKVIKIEELSSKKFWCDFCSFKTDRSSVLKGHLMRAHNFACEECEEVYLTRQELKRHIEASHDVAEMLSQSNVSAADINFDSETKIYSCSECSYTSNRKNNVKRHGDSVHKPEELSKKGFKCLKKSCNFKSTNQVELNKHLLIDHSILLKDGEQIFVCQICPETFPNQAALGSHLTDRHKNQTSQIRSKVEEIGFKKFVTRYDEARFFCSRQKCDAFFDTQQEVDKHHLRRHNMLLTDGSFIFVCPFCTFSHTLNSRLTLHIRTAHPEERQKRLQKRKALKCLKAGCQERFDTQDGVERHSLIEHRLLQRGDELIYVCLHCSYQLKQHSKLVIHVEKYHKNQGKSEIEKLLEDPSSNVSDIIERLSGAKLVCGKRDCPQRFETKDQLDNHYLHDHHMIVQDGGFVYLCPQSGCTFTSKENKLMVRHLAVKHDIRNRETSGRRRIKPESDKDWENVDPESEQLPNFSSQKPVKKVFRCRECNFECRIQSMLENHLFYSDHEYTQETKDGTVPPSVFSSAELLQIGKVFHQLYDEYLPLECKDCNIEFKEDDLLTKHEREVHGAEKIVICQFCNRKYKSRMELVQHICAVHFYRKPFLCTSCDYETSYRKNLEIHKKKNHGTSSSDNSKSGALLKKAYRTLHELCNKMVPRECKECGIKFSLFQPWIDHARDVHGNEDLLTCSFCKREHKTRSSLVQHIMGLHSKQMPFVCNQNDCLFKTSSIERFKIHLNRHKAGFGGKATSATMQSNPTTTPEFFKDLCDRIVPVACKLCPDMAFTDFRKLVEHDKAEHQIDSLVCKQCGKRFRGRPDLVQHLLGSHLHERPFTCHLCNYNTSFVKNIDKHVEAHTRGVVAKTQENEVLIALRDRLMPLVCSDCDLTFANIRNLLEHERDLHGEERALKCPHCKKKFRARTELVQHIAAHLGEKPFKCNSCDYSSSYYRLLEKHQRKEKHLN